MNEPPRGWEAMVELLALDPGPAASARAPAQPEGFFARLFKGSVARARERGEADFRRLGLATVEAAEERTRAASRVPELVGPTIVAGERYGRRVEVRIDPDRYRVKVEAAVPVLHVRSERGELRASERSPRELQDALAGLRRDARWEGAEVKGGPDGVTVFHRVERRGGGTQGYLDDLWLAERIVELLGAAGGGPPAAP